MLVRHFTHWIETAAPAARAEATAALARAYVAGDLDAAEEGAAAQALISTLDDPAPQVRAALAAAIAPSAEAPSALVVALAADLPAIAAIVLEHSPLLLDVDLVDAVGGGDGATQSAVARRHRVAPPVAAALAEVGSAEACLILLENEGATLPAFSLERIVARFGHLAAIRQALLGRADLSPAMRQMLLVRLSETLADFAIAQEWMADHCARAAAREACERATITLVAQTDRRDLAPLVEHLRISGQLSAGLVLRALLCGQETFFAAALAGLSGLPPPRVESLLRDHDGPGLRALLDRAGLPAPLHGPVRAALGALDEHGFAGDTAQVVRLQRRMVERALTACAGQERRFEEEPLLALLRRFSLEAMRDEARAERARLAA